MKPSRKYFPCCILIFQGQWLTGHMIRIHVMLHWNLFLVPEAEGAEQWQRRKWRKQYLSISELVQEPKDPGLPEINQGSQ